MGNSTSCERTEAHIRRALPAGHNPGQALHDYRRHGGDFPEGTQVTIRGGAPPWFTGATWSASEVDIYEGAFSNEENLARTLYHESLHVAQHTAFGSEFVQANVGDFENWTYTAEQDWWNTLGGR